MSSEPKKECQKCGRRLRCVFAGCYIYLAHTGQTHSGDLFCCFSCLKFFVFGMNKTPLDLSLVDGTSRAMKEPRFRVDVVVAFPVVVPYGRDSEFCQAKGDVIPLPSSLAYMVNKCLHDEEIVAYLQKSGWRPQLEAEER